ncbi:glycosaminoglycan xylosylkinase isoform X1 [Penaeus vannamei]|uniref:glycosaminoglycan xylosylkinase isoform X1 n=2 Tax=Penaeus vannamei TaxID=6689 RepID=UPI00387F4C07
MLTTLSTDTYTEFCIRCVPVKFRFLSEMPRLLLYVLMAISLSAVYQILNVSRTRNLRQTTEYMYRTTTPAVTLSEKEKNVFLQEETFALREVEGDPRGNKNRPGLRLLSSLYAHRPAVMAKYSSPSPYLAEFIEELKRDLTVRGVAEDPWALARKWAKPKSLVPESAPGLADVLAALSTAPVVAADSFDGGKQLKLLLQFEGNQKAIFKVMRYNRTAVITIMNSGKDRHNGEIVAFHAARLLGLQMAPVAVGRRIQLAKEILPVASKRLAKTFFTDENGQLCFSANLDKGEQKNIQCPTKDNLTEGVVIMWIPEHLKLLEMNYPWRHYYKSKRPVKWEQDETYCEAVSSGIWANRLLDFIDMSVLDFLTQNTDRHHFLLADGDHDASVIPIDNGRSFGDPDIDYMDILAPVLQCCRFRAATHARLVLLSGGGLSRALRELLRLDPLAPVLADAHLRALDRRLAHVLAALSACSEKKGGWHNVLS